MVHLFLLVILWWIVVLVFGSITQAVRMPFDLFKNFVYQHPLETTRVVVGALTSALIAYLFHLPYTFEISIGGGVLLFIAGEFS